MILLNAMVDQQGYVLWLCSWYPNKLEPLAGDFIQRHAKAVAAKLPVYVLTIVVDESAQITRKMLVEKRVEGHLTETIVYVHLVS